MHTLHKPARAASDTSTGLSRPLLARAFELLLLATSRYTCACALYGDAVATKAAGAHLDDRARDHYVPWQRECSLY